MDKKEFKNRLAGIVYNVEIIDDTHRHNTSEIDPDDSYDRPNTITDHNIVGFRAALESDDKYYDLAVSFEPNFKTTYYVLYAVYSTGDSFGQDDHIGIEFIGFYTENELDVANRNMHTIETHTGLGHDYKFSIMLRTPNDGRNFEQTVPWTGYFEHLDYVNIASIERQK